MNANCTVYIDEAGDLGIGRGTRWFVLTAVQLSTECNFETIYNNLQ